MAEQPPPRHLATEQGDRAYLDVPYAEKDVAKALGARWDQAARRVVRPPAANGRA